MFRSRTRNGFIGGVIAAMALCTMPCLADVPNLIDFQGSLTDAQSAPVSGQRQLTLALYAADSGGSTLWQETQTITVLDGIYSVSLGAQTPFPEDLWETAQLWLGVQVGTEPEMAPRVRIVAVPYALRAKTAETLAAGAGGFPAGGLVTSVHDNDPALLADGYAPPP